MCRVLWAAMAAGCLHWPTLGADQGEHAGHAARRWAPWSARSRWFASPRLLIVSIKYFLSHRGGRITSGRACMAKLREANQPERPPSALPKLKDEVVAGLANKAPERSAPVAHKTVRIEIIEPNNTALSPSCDFLPANERGDQLGGSLAHINTHAAATELKQGTAQAAAHQNMARLRYRSERITRIR